MASKAEAPLVPGPDERERILKNPALVSYLEEIEEAAMTARTRPIVSLSFSAFRRFDETGDRLGFESLYFERRRALVALALASWLWGGRDDLAALEDELWAVCDEYDWALPAHLDGKSLDPGEAARGTLDLFACETAFALAEIVELVGERIAPIVAERAKREVERRVLGPFLAKKGRWSWEEKRNNWCAVCAGSIGAAALYLIRDEARLDAVLARVIPTLGRFLESFADDGTCLEGLGYWTYGVGFYVSFAELLTRSGRGGVDLLSGGKFRRIAAFQAKGYLNGSIAVSFADGSSRERYRIGLTAFLAGKFAEAAAPAQSLAAGFKEDHSGRWCLSFRDLLWANADRGSPEPQAAISWLPDSQWLICPAPFGDLAFAAKGGHNDEPHNHNDVGSFELVVGREQILADLGRGEYTKDYFGDGRYGILCNSSLGHNLPIIDGRGQEAGLRRRARQVDFRGVRTRAMLSMEISAAYDCPVLVGLRRTFDYGAGSGDAVRSLILEDDFEFERPGVGVVERFVTLLPEESIRKGPDGLVIDFGENSLSIACSLACEAVVSRHVHRDHGGMDTPVACIDFALPASAPVFSVKFAFRLSERRDS